MCSTIFTQILQLKITPTPLLRLYSTAPCVFHVHISSLLRFPHLMKPRTALSRQERCISKAVHMVWGGATFRKASHHTRIPLATIHYRLKNQTSSAPGNRTRHAPALKAFEEDVIVQTMCRYPDRGIPPSTQHLCDAVEIVGHGMDAERRKKLPFKNSKPGHKFVRSFRKRHSARQNFCRPTGQEAVRFASVNSETLTSHLVNLEKLFQKYQFDAERIWNLNETGATTGRDVDGNPSSLRILRRHG